MWYFILLVIIIIINLVVSSSKEGRKNANDHYIYLAAAIIKADKKVETSELQHVYNFLKKKYNVATANRKMARLKTLLRRNLNVDLYCREYIYGKIRRDKRLLILFSLFDIAFADDNFHPAEDAILRKIANSLQIPKRSYEKHKAMYTQEYYAKKESKEHTYTNNKKTYNHNKKTSQPKTIKPHIDSAYKVLGLSKEALDDEIKNAYRNMVKAHHPDLYQGENEFFLRNAKERIQKINEAYEIIKDDRKIK